MGGGFIRLRLFMFQYALFVLQSIETPRCCRGDTEALLGHEVSRQSIEPAYTLRAGASAHYRETTGRGGMQPEAVHNRAAGLFPLTKASTDRLSRRSRLRLSEGMA